jgi:hypothetical protein
MNGAQGKLLVNKHFEHQFNQLGFTQKKRRDNTINYIKQTPLVMTDLA